MIKDIDTGSLFLIYTRFTEVAEQLMVWWLEITGKFDVSLLSDDTLYAAFFALSGIILLMVFASPLRLPLSCLAPTLLMMFSLPWSVSCKIRAMKKIVIWYEVELGHFFKRRGDMGQIQMGLKEIKRRFEKKGIILHGIEIMPIIP